MYELIKVCIQPMTALVLLFVVICVRLQFVNKRRPWLVTSLAIVLILSCSPLGAYLAQGSIEWRHPPLLKRPADADVIILLSAGFRPPDERGGRLELGPSTTFRCFTAKRLYKDGAPIPIVVCGGELEPLAKGVAISDLMRDLLVELGVRESDIRIEKRSRSTFENAVNCAEILKELDKSNAIVVTDAIHLDRAVRCFQKQGYDVTPAGANYRTTGFHLGVTSFLPTAGGANDVRRASHEWIGLVWYRMKGWI